MNGKTSAAGKSAATERQLYSFPVAADAHRPKRLVISDTSSVDVAQATGRWLSAEKVLEVRR